MHLHFDPETVLREGLELFGFKPDRLQEESKNRRFHEKYCAGPNVVAALWKDIGVDINGASLKHLFWTLHYYKSYPKEGDVRNLFSADPGTVRRWVRTFTTGLEALASQKIVLPLPDDRVYYLSIDRTDFRIEEPIYFDHSWYSHKFKKAAVKYEVAMTMDGMIAWINGPFRGSEHDLAIFHQGLMDQIPEGWLVIADQGYRGEPHVLDIPNPSESDEVKDFNGMVLACQETVNKRFKDFAIISQVFCNSNGDPIASHKPIFYAIAVVTQYKIEHGEELFDVYV